MFAVFYYVHARQVPSDADARVRRIYWGLEGKKVRLNGIAASAGSKGGVVQAVPAREC